MSSARIDHARALRRALLLDAAASGTMGLLLVSAAVPLAELLGLAATLLRWVGIVLVPFALLLVWLARQAFVPRGLVQLVIAGNALWVVGSVLLLVSGALSATRLGALFVLAQAAAVAVFTWLEYAALRHAAAAASALAAGAVFMPGDAAHRQ